MRFLKERASAEDYRRHLGLVNLVRRDFEQLSYLLTKAGEQKDASLPQIDRIVLYIDDLDRCRADRVTEVLEAVHLLLAFPLFTVVVAVDPRWLRQSLLDHYPHLLGGVGDEGSKLRKRSLAKPATPQDYLEKIFQVPFNLQPMEKTGFAAMVALLFPAAGPAKPEVQPSLLNPEAQSPKDLTPVIPIPPVTSAAPTAVTESKVVAVQPVETPASPLLATVLPEAAKPQSDQPPPDPQRLTLTKKEVADVQRFQPLFQTPRAVKRLANTYCLIRVGVNEDEWSGYLGPDEKPGIYRVPMLLLAVASAFPTLARPWMLWLQEKTPARWQIAGRDIADLTTKYWDTTDGTDWKLLACNLDQLDLDGWPAPESKVIAKWAPRVARYSF